jgi:hypothetical protein
MKKMGPRILVKNSRINFPVIYCNFLLTWTGKCAILCNALYIKGLISYSEYSLRPVRSHKIKYIQKFKKVKIKIFK